MPSIFDRLNFPTTLSTETAAYSEKTLNTMNAMPKLLNDWQNEDISNSSTTGYFKNPILPYTANLKIVITNIEAVSNTANLTTIRTTANTTLPKFAQFDAHTNRLSGVVEINSSTSSLPHYENAIGVGKVLAHLVFQSDGISNNAVMIGSFGALYSANTLKKYYDTIQPYPLLIQNSIFVSPGGNVFSSLTNTQITTINSELSNLSSYLTNTINSDVNFFTNSRAVLDDYNNVKIFTKMGQTENDLTKTLIGSDKLLSRIT